MAIQDLQGPREPRPSRWSRGEDKMDYCKKLGASVLAASSTAASSTPLGHASPLEG